MSEQKTPAEPENKLTVLRGPGGRWLPGAVPNPKGAVKRGESIAELLSTVGKRKVIVFKDGKPLTTKTGRPAKIEVKEYLLRKVYDLAITGYLSLDREINGKFETKQFEVTSLAQWMEIMEWLVSHMDNGQPASTTRAMEWSISDNVLRVIEHTDTGSVASIEEANDEQ